VTVSNELLTAGTTGRLPAPAGDAPPARKPEPAALSPEPALLAPPITIARPSLEPAAEPLRPPVPVAVAVATPAALPATIPPPRPLQETTVGEALAAPAPPKAMGASIPTKVDVVDDRALVQQTLQRYRSAYEGLDAQSAHAVWPAVNQVALARAFNGLESQALTFETCDVRVRGEAATATCQGTARYVPKVGSREPRIEPRVWNFTLRKSGTDWKIDSARAER